MHSAHVSDHIRSSETWDQRPCSKEEVQEPPEGGVAVLVPLQGKQSALLITNDTKRIGCHWSCVDGRTVCCFY